MSCELRRIGCCLRGQVSQELHACMRSRCRARRPALCGRACPIRLAAPWCARRCVGDYGIVPSETCCCLPWRCRCRGRPGLWPFTCQPGPDWPCNVCTFGLILGPTIPFLLLVAPKLHWAVVLAGVLLTGVTAALLALTAFSDPGYVPKQTPAQMEVQRQQMEEQGLSGTFTVCRECWVGLGALLTYFADAADRVRRGDSR